MDFETFRPILSGIIGGLLAPFLMAFWSRLSPPSEISSFDSIPDDLLIQRNNWIDNVGSALSLVGICVPLVFYSTHAVSSRNPWPLGLGFGLMVILPVAFISAVTLPKGFNRYREFWRFYELKYGIGLTSVTVLYILLGALALVSAYKLVP